MSFHDSWYWLDKSLNDRQKEFLAEAALYRLVKRSKRKNAAISTRARQWLVRQLVACGCRQMNSFRPSSDF